MDPDAHAVYMLTSGSTGMPKAVVQTQRMLSTNMHQAFQTLGEAAGWNDVMLDWLPWSHVSGAFNLLAAAVFGGTLYIDDGKPAPGLFEETIRNLREIAVPYFCNVPAGFAVLVDVLESDELLRKRFFSKLRMILYGGAGLPQPILNRLQTMAINETGFRIFMTSGYGATETASGCMAISWDTDKVGIGLPMPGLETKLVPQGDRYEVRLRGDNVMPGYLDNEEGTAKAFDDEGFYRTGDAARFHDEDDVNQGLYFAGRLAEEFKLGTGTWVYAGQVRAKLIEALAPAIGDLLLCGIGRDHLAVLGVPNLAGLREIAGEPGAELADLTGNMKVREFIDTSLQAYNAENSASSKRIRRFAFMREAPNAARHEISDKGTLNQLIASENRAEEIDELYAPSPGQHVLVT
jgi:feruloyl-CoA synthase